MGTIHNLLSERGLAQLELDLIGDDLKTARIAARFMSDERVGPSFIHPAICLTTLPYRAQDSGVPWIRDTGRARLMIQPVSNADGVTFGVPYGSRARLILLYLMTSAVMNRSRFVELGSSMYGWLKSMGIPVCGKNYAAVIDQAQRIEHSLFTFRYRGDDSETQIKDLFIRGSFRPFRAPNEKTVELSEGFFDALVRRPVPVVEAAVRLLSDTCMAFDTYLWLAYRLHSLQAPQFVPWTALHAQFGADTRMLKHFKPRFAGALKAALAVYPEGKAIIVEGGCLLEPSSPPIRTVGFGGYRLTRRALRG
jgi:hypothetical protein